MENIKAQISNEVDALAQDMYDISDFLKANPEIAYQEYKACDHLSGVLEKKGFQVQKGVGGVETSFLAQPVDRQPRRPTVAFLAEYDALPKIGHGCGHNLIAAASLGAAIALNRVLKIDSGGLVVVGTPAEEGGGGKAHLAEAGVFDEMDLAMMFHPGGINIAGKDMLGRIKFKMEFFGRTAHASGSPDKGINALDAMVATYTSINAIRQHLRPDGRIHGIITHGGDAPNIIPDYGRRGSSDIGNLSHYLPSMHPVLAIVEPNIPGHSVEFREATTSERGRKAVLNAAKMLALTAYDFLTSEEMRFQVTKKFNT